MILDFQNIIVLISFALTMSLVLILYRYGRSSISGKAYSVAVLTIAGWVFPMFLYRADVFGAQLLWARLLYVMASLTSTSFLYFACVFPDNDKIPRWLEIVLLVENLIIIGICFIPGYLITGLQRIPGEETIILWGPYYIVYAFHISLLFLVAFIILFLKRRKATGIIRTQISYILVVYFFSSNFAMMTNLVLPWIGYFSLNWLGQFFSTVVAIMTTYAIVKHNLLHIKLFATEGFLFVLNLLLFIQFIVSENQKQFLVNGVVLFSVFLVSVLLIQSAYKEIKRTEELTILAKSLEQANIQLRELDKQKTDFLSFAAHQLRTPLSVLNGYIELLGDNGYGKIPKEAKNVLKNMDESNMRLVKLVDNFLDITRLEQGRTKYDFVEKDVNELIREVIKDLDERAKQKGITLEWTPINLPKVFIDEEKIRNVIYNFVDNAIKYSESGQIKIISYKEKEGIGLRVEDCGRGFDKVDEASFFQKFYRGQNVQGINVNGTGLGLYVCRMFVEAHRGKVWARSEGIGKGSEFGFWIPIKALN